MNSVKTNFQIVSDLHIERFYPTVPRIEDFITVKPKSQNYISLILAGDIGRVELWDQFSMFMSQVCTKFLTVYMVAGNHEYYTAKKTPIEILRGNLQSLGKSLKNFVFLDDSYVFLGHPKKPSGLLFGGTFWSHIPDKFRGPLPPIYYRGVNKHNQITETKLNFLHFKSRNALENCVEYAQSENLPLFVVSHHAPSFYKTLHPKYKKNMKNCLYCTDYDRQLWEINMKIWVYGHTGYNSDYITSGGTRLLSNQCDKDTIDKCKIISFP